MPDSFWNCSKTYLQWLHEGMYSQSRVGVCNLTVRFQEQSLYYCTSCKSFHVKSTEWYPIDMYFFFGGFHLLFSVYMWVLVSWDVQARAQYLDPLGWSVFQGNSHFLPKAKLLPTLRFSTGSAGLIQTIQMFSRHSIVAAIMGTIATVGWTIQTLGNAFYFRQARFHMLCNPMCSSIFVTDLGSSHCSWSLNGQGEE